MEGFTLALGAAVVKSAMKLWLSDQAIAADASASAVDALVRKLNSVRDQRKLQRLFDQLEETVADRLAPLLEREFRSLDEGEHEAAVSAVRETLEKAALTDQDLFDLDLDAGYLDRHLRAAVPDRPQHFGLSEAGTEFYDRLLRECCSALVEITKTLPRFQAGALAALLQRDTEILDLVREVLRRIPDRRSAVDFEADYRQQVVALLDRMEFFGATLSESSRRYPLSVAYLSLSASAKYLHDVRIEEILAKSSRLLIRGQAGAGKTTLLQWLAVRCAARDVPSSLRKWGDLLPFFIPLREYANGELPTPEQFLRRVGRHIADEMPAGWVQERLRRGEAVVLIDGVDELSADHRNAARAWLRELVSAFPHARYVVTSRPAAIDFGWLDDEGFTVAELQPMTQRDVDAFIHRWHEAMRSQSTEADERKVLDLNEQRLLQMISFRGPLRRLAETPLLCALLCALNRDRHGEIPNDRMTLYRTALDMLLGRRDEERGLKRLPGLFQTEQLLLLQDIAYWLVKNSESDAERVRVRNRIAARLASLGRVSAGPDEVLQYLLERSGLLREPVAGRLDFVHRTFQEYLAAKAAIESDDIGLLMEHASADQWREVIILAAGLASRRQADTMIRTLLQPPVRRRHLLLAVACMETVSALDPVLRAEVQQSAKALVPPHDLDAVRTLAASGEFIVDLLAEHSDYSDPNAVVCAIQTAGMIGGKKAMGFLSRFAAHLDADVLRALVSASTAFDLDEYARTVLKDAQVQQTPIHLTEVQQIPALLHVRNLRRLRLVYNGDLARLASLADRLTLTHLDILNPHSVPVDLSELTDLTGLIELTVEGPSRNWAAIAGLPALQSLRLESHGHGRVDELCGPPQVRHLELRDVVDQQDLSCLGFLEAPRSLQLVNWSNLRDVSLLSRWAPTLKELSLAGSPVTDLTPLQGLTNLVRLDLFRTAAGKGVDLSPLAGLKGLVVEAGPDAETRWEDLLGSGRPAHLTD